MPEHRVPSVHRLTRLSVSCMPGARRGRKFCRKQQAVIQQRPDTRVSVLKTLTAEESFHCIESMEIPILGGTDVAYNNSTTVPIWATEKKQSPSFKAPRSSIKTRYPQSRSDGKRPLAYSCCSRCYHYSGRHD